MIQKNATQNLMEELADQLDFLEKSATAYDNGYDDEIIRQATVIKVMIDDTHYSTCLLTRLGRKGIEFLDSSNMDEDSKTGAFARLVEMIEVESTEVAFPILDDGNSTQHKEFDVWWHETVLVDATGNHYTRANIVNLSSSQKIYESVDESINADYDALKNKNLLGWPGGSDEKDEILRIDNLFPSMRQITHEVIKTIKLDYTCHKGQSETDSTESSHDAVFGDNSDFPMSFNQERTAQSGKKVGRNDPCPCGSGKKYKKCCMIN